MSTEELSKVVLSVFDQEKGPLPFRKIEALVVLQDVDVSTYEVQRAVSRLVEKGMLTEDDNFRYKKAGAAAPK
jgi:hypothetical protein